MSEREPLENGDKDDLGNGEQEQFDDVEELVAEVAAVAEAADLRVMEQEVLREHAEENERRLANVRHQRIGELYDQTLAILQRVQAAGPLHFVESTNLEPGSRPINVRWERPPRRHIVLDFNHYRGTIRVYQLTTDEGIDVVGGRISREIDAASDDAASEIEAALRWTWHPEAGRTP